MHYIHYICYEQKPVFFHNAFCTNTTRWEHTKRVEIVRINGYYTDEQMQLVNVQLLNVLLLDWRRQLAELKEFLDAIELKGCKNN